MRPVRMQLNFLSLLCLLGYARSIPIDTTEENVGQYTDAITVVKNSWSSVGNAYRRFDLAVQGVKPGPANAGKTDVPAAHNNILAVLKSTMSAVRGLKPVGTIDAMLNLTPAVLTLRETELAALNTVIRARAVIVQVGERVPFRKALVEQVEYHTQWSQAFKNLVPTSQLQSYGQAITDQVMEAYRKAISAYS
jgi:hypothetical protein